MVESSFADLTGLSQAKLQSERVRIACMMAVVGLLALLGIVRVAIPIDGVRSFGWFVLGISAIFLAVEAAMYFIVQRAIRQNTSLDWRLGTAHAVTECLYPLLAIVGLWYLDPNRKFTLLVSPAYAFLMILIAVSVLRVDARATLLTGAFSTIGYGVLAAVALSGDGPPNPHPAGMYVTLTLALALATVVSAFVAARVRGYLWRPSANWKSDNSEIALSEI